MAPKTVQNSAAPRPGGIDFGFAPGKVDLQAMGEGLDFTKPYKFIGFGGIDVTKPYKFIGFGGIDFDGRPGP